MTGGVLFACDIDNTIIYSHRRAQPGWSCVEWLDGREQAYMSPGTIEHLAGIRPRLALALVTSRSIGQYRRLMLPVRPAMAVTANGADLHVGGDIDPAWRAETNALLEPWRAELERCFERLSASGRYGLCRAVDDAYAFVRCPDGELPEAEAARIAGDTALDVVASGRKIYLLPPPLNKGAALRRLMARTGRTVSLAAGDSDMDVSMLRAADVAIAPEALGPLLPQGAKLCPPDRLFSEFALETALELIGAAGEQNSMRRAEPP